MDALVEMSVKRRELEHNNLEMEALLVELFGEALHVLEVLTSLFHFLVDGKHVRARFMVVVDVVEHFLHQDLAVPLLNDVFVIVQRNVVKLFRIAEHVWQLTCGHTS